MLFGLAHEFQEAPWHQLSGPAWRGRLGSSVQLAQTELKSCWRRCRTGRREPGECATEDTFNMDESGLYYGAAQSPLARGRTAGNKKDKKRMTVALTVQLVHSS
jgi:hypothetical protein